MKKTDKKKVSFKRRSFLFSNEFWDRFTEFCEKEKIDNRSGIVRRGVNLIIANPILLEKDTIELDYNILYTLVRAFEKTKVTITGLPEGGGDRIRELMGEARIAEVRNK